MVTKKRKTPIMLQMKKRILTLELYAVLFSIIKLLYSLKGDRAAGGLHCLDQAVISKQFLAGIDLRVKLPVFVIEGDLLRTVS